MAGYISRNLGVNEQVVLSGKTHWVCLIPSLIVVFIAIVISLIMMMGGASASTSGMIAMLLIIFAIFSMAAPNLIAMYTTEVGFTNKNFIGKTGLINTKVLNSPLNKLQNVSAESGLWGKLFGYGTITVNSASGTYKFKNIAQADTFRTNLLQAIEQYEQDRIKQSAQEMAAAMKGTLN